MNGSVPEKYRGVKFSTYRPCWTEDASTTSADTQQDDNGYTVGNTYWFKYEPLVWRVLDSSTGLVMCESIIDSQAYNNYIWYGAGSKSTSSEYYANANTAPIPIIQTATAQKGLLLPVSGISIRGSSYSMVFSAGTEISGSSIIRLIHSILRIYWAYLSPFL
ncbi:MAG: hypothetical protein MJ173_08785 [Clostridia bacterium]|nr:hypothetical protein [Clostridia bacterium]